MIARTNKLSLLALISFQMIFAGCIVLPIPTGEDKILDGMPVTEDQLKFLKVGVTSRDEVISHLGNPSLIWENAQLFVYNWKMRSGILVWAVGAGYTGGAGILDIPVNYALLIKFDDQDRISRFEKVKRPFSKQYGDFLRDWVKGPEKSKPEENQSK